MLQILAQCRWGGDDDQSYSPARIGSDKLEDNACGQLKSNSNSPYDFRSNGHNILMGAPKTTRHFNLTA